MNHKLKTTNPYFQRCWDQEKTFEVRNNDRDFQKGDTICLQEYDERLKMYSGREIIGTILYVLSGYPGIEKGYVVFSFSVDQCIGMDKAI